ncbi:RNA-binding motif protein, X chromosome-like isoform X2 [Senna tora]|uniref:RNA-binding motif protein, X chromosome-like isoform X2 n=1 Tax=Senna tora TaxID=362788 RepID=A0A834TI57_9FABA|nr:RNA-binding motif protein, X chromosome-like isoform X2 [Senna tora]
MGEYGYTYQNSSSYGSRTDEPYLGPALRKPFVPYVPNSNRSVATSPYGDEYSRSHNNRSRDDYEYGRRQTSPNSSRFTPAATTEWRASPQPYNYNGAAGYGDYGYGNREGQYRAVGNDNYYGNGYEKASSGYGPNDNYDGYEAPISYSSSSRAKNNNNTSGWAPPPRNGTQLNIFPTLLDVGIMDSHTHIQHVQNLCVCKPRKTRQNKIL